MPSTAPGAASATRVPFLDLARTHGSVADEIVADFASVVALGAFVNGPAVAAFERAYARYCAAAWCLGTGSGLDALRLGLIAAGVEPGDEVVVPANTFVATVEAVVQVGARPVLVDATEDDYNLDVEATRAAVGRRTRLLLPVHLYGQLADMRAVRRLADAAGLLVLEDACQAHGATREGVRPGELATAAAFSFYPGKNLGAFGDAGALVTNDSVVAEQVRMLREHGQREKYVHELSGYTSRLDTLQAAALLRKLPLLDGWTRDRATVAEYYRTALDGVGDLVLPPVAPESRPAWHLFVVRTAAPEELARHLGERGVATGRHYPIPVHLTGAFRSLGHRRGEFPVSEAIASEGLSLPIFPGMTEAELSAVVDGVDSFFRG